MPVKRGEGQPPMAETKPKQTLADAADNWMPDGWRDSVRPRDPDAEDDPTYGCRYCGKLYRKCTCTNAEIYEYELELRGRKHEAYVESNFGADYASPKGPTTDPVEQFHAADYLGRVINWLNYHNEDLNFGLRSPEDACKLFDEWIKGCAIKSYPEFCDDEYDEDGQALAPIRTEILGYDPLADMGHSLLPRDHDPGEPPDDGLGIDEDDYDETDRRRTP